MTKAEAYQVMLLGQKVCHRFYTDEEYLFIEYGVFKTEDGYKHGGVNDEFWQVIQKWEEDWSIYEPKVDDNKFVKEVTGWDTKKEFDAYQKGREHEENVISKFIENWDGSTNSVIGELLMQKANVVAEAHLRSLHKFVEKLRDVIMKERDEKLDVQPHMSEMYNRVTAILANSFASIMDDVVGTIEKLNKPK